jgi:hypothetical protein
MLTAKLFLCVYSHNVPHLVPFNTGHPLCNVVSSTSPSGL